jgi:hypothetical protein
MAETGMTCRNCDKIEPRGCGKTCCSVTGDVILDFDKKCDVPIDTVEEK